MSRVPSYMGLGAPNNYPKKLSTASTKCSIDVEDAGRVLLWNGQSSATRIVLPTPEFGLHFIFLLISDAVSSGTKIGTSAFDIVLAGSTGKYAAFGSTSEDGQAIEFIGISDNRYVAIPRALSSGAGGVWAVGSS